MTFTRLVTVYSYSCVGHTVDVLKPEYLDIEADDGDRASIARINRNISINTNRIKIHNRFIVS